MTESYNKLVEEFQGICRDLEGVSDTQEVLTLRERLMYATRGLTKQYWNLDSSERQGIYRILKITNLAIENSYDIIDAKMFVQKIHETLSENPGEAENEL